MVIGCPLKLPADQLLRGSPFCIEVVPNLKELPTLLSTITSPSNFFNGFVFVDSLK
jgi:hypothetical protein